MGKKATNAEKRLKKLYVLLGRIGGLDDYVWEDMNLEDQVEAFDEMYDRLKAPDEINGNSLKDRFTLASVLTGTITKQDRSFNTLKQELTGDDILIQEETLLHRAISLIGYNQDESSDTELRNIIKRLTKDTPFLLDCDRRGSPEYDGQSPLHLAVLKEDKELVENIAQAMVDAQFSLDPVASGSKFEGTVMMAGTPLCVAALTLNRETFQILLGKRDRIDKESTTKEKVEGANIAGTNKNLENVCHSLVKYAHHCPDKMDNICKMLEFILKCEWNKERDRQCSTETQKLLMMENKDGLNPLQLATEFRLHQIFKELFGYEVYCKKNLQDVLRDDQWYDVTEIDTIPVTVTTPTDNEKLVDKKERHVSVLPTLLLQSPHSAIKFLEFPPIRQVIEQKWNKYKWLFGIWGVLHLVFMICLSYSAFRRADLTNDPNANTNETLSDRPNFTGKVLSEPFVTFMCVLGFIIGIAYICIQFKICITGISQNTFKLTDINKELKYPHSNIMYRWMFVLFSVCLILDFIIAMSQVDTYENYMLMAAVILGSYLLLFFIQMIKYFSFFTALIQVAMVDLLKFGVVMSIFLLSFSMAMYMVMQGADTDDDTFRSYASTLMKMFNVMLGLGDIDTLFLARQPLAAIVVFVTFVLLTTLLLLNALLAIMANTCSSLLSRSGDVTAYKLHYRLHKLSTILFMEYILPQKFQVSVGVIKERRRFKANKWYNNVRRRMIPHSCLTSKSENLLDELSVFEDLMHYIGARKSKDKNKTDSKVGPTLSPAETIGTQSLTRFNQLTTTDRDWHLQRQAYANNESSLTAKASSRPTA